MRETQVQALGWEDPISQRAKPLLKHGQRGTRFCHKSSPDSERPCPAGKSRPHGRLCPVGKISPHSERPYPTRKSSPHSEKAMPHKEEQPPQKAVPCGEEQPPQ